MTHQAMTRRTLLGAGAAAGIGALPASDRPLPRRPPIQAEPVTLRFMTHNTLEKPAGDVLKEMIAEFEAAEPGHQDPDRGGPERGHPHQADRLRRGRRPARRDRRPVRPRQLHQPRCRARHHRPGRRRGAARVVHSGRAAGRHRQRGPHPRPAVLHRHRRPLLPDRPLRGGRAGSRRAAEDLGRSWPTPPRR